MLLLCAGNDNLHLLTSNTRQRLRVDLADFQVGTAFAEYDYFMVRSARAKFILASLGTYRGTAGQYGVKLWTRIMFWAAAALRWSRDSVVKYLKYK